MSTPSSTASSMPSLSPRSASRLSRVNTSSGSFTQRSLQAFRTVSLPGLLPGTSLGILASGLLDKRRDGAVRGGWAKRLFILSTRSLHYYRKAEEYELFGKERGQSPLADISLAKIVAPEDAPYGAVEPGMPSYFIAVISKRKSLLMFLRADTLELAMNWVNTINRAVQVAKTVNFSSRWPLEVIQKFTAVASGQFEEPAVEEVETPDSPAEVMQPTAPGILMISVASPPSHVSKASRERLIKRQVDLGEEVELGKLLQKDVCIIVLTDGEEVQVLQSLLGPDVKRLLSEEKEVVLSTPPRSKGVDSCVVSTRRVYATFRCEKAPPVPLKTQTSGVTPANQIPASVLSNAFPGGLGGLFLLSCVVAFWLAHPFEGLMKVTIFVGTVLALSQVAQVALSVATGKNETIGRSSSVKDFGVPAVAQSTVDDGPVFFLRIDKVEVVEQEQEPPKLVDSSSVEETTTGESDAAESDNGDIAYLKQISGGPLPFSHRFIAAEKGDEEKGRQRYENTLQWRKENDIDDILIRPHPTFETIKKYYPQFFHGRSKAGLPIYYEQPGKINLPALKKEGLSIEDLLRHYMYITEYLWRVIEPSDTGRSVTVLDVSGIGMSDLGGEVLDFIKRASAFTGAHYPERSAHIFIINIPGWFNMIWRMIKPLIDPVTREKIHMLKGSAILRELETLVDLDNIPSDFGGRGCRLGESQEENELREHVAKFLNA
ncbi:hypothetical protein Poli38472_003978 [Pythium oligandrum]|uniref:CRAL-TRIO domain-containing protein n=1 Tax=Pythium oligandrum TaxID=41045 RepID=A0A8K1CNM5_PYTOL|nr:hypothetical protein Poli38472_003978 [Pythium oligandrum]|eukprot:TMW66213.1 hypothetical protein Poli38472_003978 [Pythium oligandrum]